MRTPVKFFFYSMIGGPPDQHSIPSKYDKVLDGKCSLTKTFELSSHVLRWKENDVPRNNFSSLNYPHNCQIIIRRGQAADASF